MLLLSRRNIPGLWNPGNGSAWGVSVAKGDIACGASDSQGTKDFMEHEQDFCMAVHSGEILWIFCCLKKENRQRSRDEGERISID